MRSRFGILLIILLASSHGALLFAEQGVYVPPDKSQKDNVEIVRMKLGDNAEVPVINVGPQGPTILRFPAALSICNMSSKIYTTEIISTKKEKEGDFFKMLIINVKVDALTEEQVDLLTKDSVKMVCVYSYENGKQLFRAIKIKLNLKKNHSVVFFEDAEDGREAATSKEASGFEYIKIENGKGQKTESDVTTLKIENGKIKEVRE